ncbi:MAG: hypothetical protein ACI4GD_03700 [Lachnospiraceae bacterium]
MKAFLRKIEIFLKSHGIESLTGFMIPGWLFLGISIVAGISLLIFLAVMGMKGLLLIILTVSGFFLPFLIIFISNRADNDNMLTDIKNIFESLKIQMHAGIYILDALENCLKHIENKRLKQGIERLLRDIFMSKNTFDALNDFNSRFSNIHIDMLVIILKQAFETGFSVNNLDSAFEQVLDVEKAICVKEENSVERNVQLIQVFFMAGLIAISVYCSVIEFKEIFEIF